MFGFFSWIGIKHKTRHYEGENSFIHIHEIYKENSNRENIEHEDDKKCVQQ